MLPIIAGIVASLVQAKLPKVAEAVVDKGLDYVQDKLGVKLEPEMSQEKLAEIATKAQEHEEFLITSEIQDKANARNMQVEALKQEDVFSKRFIYYLASFWSFCATLYMFLITFFTIPPDNLQTVSTISGFLLGTVVSTIIGFFFGSTLSSKRNNETIIKSQLQDRK